MGLLDYFRSKTVDQVEAEVAQLRRQREECEQRLTRATLDLEAAKHRVTELASSVVTASDLLEGTERRLTSAMAELERKRRKMPRAASRNPQGGEA